jgi:glycosyltransferase involved in cell wall biosynthesis
MSSQNNAQSSVEFVRVSLSNKIYGGNFYENSLDKIFQKIPGISYSVLRTHFRLKGPLRLLEFPRILFELNKASFSGKTIINNYISIPLMPFVKNGITIVHHIDSSASPLMSRWYQNTAEFILKHFYSRSNHIVVESKYWEQVIRALGFTRVSLIYVGLPIEKYLAITDDQVAAFKEKYHLDPRRPLVYIGNPQVGKGYRIVFEELKNEGYTLATSGVGQAQFDHPHFDLDFESYLCLLKAASCVVTFSQFKEGWCIVAHEGALCGTPVVGSGSGGMGELLQTTGQITCSDRKELKAKVKQALLLKQKGAPSRGEQYSLERFENSWQNLIQMIQAGSL